MPRIAIVFAAGFLAVLLGHQPVVAALNALGIAPAGFTHTHRGNMPVGGDKYIATSWILFTRAERLYVPS